MHWEASENRKKKERVGSRSIGRLARISVTDVSLYLAPTAVEEAKVACLLPDRRARTNSIRLMIKVIK